jgi:hypothetical protein
MGRPIKKKFFGNTNYSVPGTSSDDKIGGEGVASVTVTTAGNYNGVLPNVTFSDPSIPTGVLATGIVHGKAVQVASIAAAGTGYAMGNVLTAVSGTRATAATFTVTGVVTTSVTMINGGNAYDFNDELWFDTAGWSTPLKIRVTSSTGGVINPGGFTVIQQGVWTGPGAAPTTITGVPPTYNGSIDNNGNGAVFNLTWGVSAVSITNDGDYTVAPANPVATTVAPAGGTGATLNTRWGVESVEMTENGSGYITVADALPSFTAASGPGTQTAVGVAVLEALQENAIVAVDLDTGGIVDIVRQENSSSYWVRGTAPYPYLLNLAHPSQSRGLYIQATDSSGTDYWVKKMMSNLVVLGVIGSGDEFNENDNAKWTFGTAEAGRSVKIRNAA